MLKARRPKALYILIRVFLGSTSLELDNLIKRSGGWTYNTSRLTKS